MQVLYASYFIGICTAEKRVNKMASWEKNKKQKRENRNTGISIMKNDNNVKTKNDRNLPLKIGKFE